MVAFADDDGILAAQIAQAGKSRPEHGMSRYIAETTFLIEFLQACFYRSDVADDAVFGKHRQHVPESVQCVFHRGGIDDQLRLEFLDFLQGGETVGVIDKTQLVRVDVEHGRLVLKTQHVCKEGTHFAGSKY